MQQKRPCVDPLTPSSPLFSSRAIFLFALVVRLIPALFLPQTYFQPDEFWQALEPAHSLVFGSGWLTWEWRQGANIRGWLWPMVFAGVYKVLELLNFDDTNWLTRAPRLVMAVVAATTDWYTYRLAGNELGVGYRETALFLSLTNLFHAHALTRALSTSAETCLTVAALYYWPLPGVKGKLTISLVLSAIAFVIRPTNVVLWGVLALELASPSVILRAMVVGAVVLAGSTMIDWMATGTIYFAPLNFARQNVLASISTFYGTSPWHYHLTQSIPILLTTSLPFAVVGWWHALKGQEANPRLRQLARASLITVIAWSCLAHKEWRFLHPLLPIWLIFAASELIRQHEVIKGGALASPVTAVHGFLRIDRRPFLWLLLAPVVPYVYLTAFHGVAQVAVVDWIRNEGMTDETIAFLMPCHSTPWQSHMHASPQNQHKQRFLTCDPPVAGVESDPNLDAAHFYDRQMIRDDPEFLVIFGEAVKRLDLSRYDCVWSAWNGFDILQDDARRTGGVQVWRKNDHVVEKQSNFI